MNRDQVNHLKKRIEDIFREKTNLIKDFYKKVPNGLDFNEKYKAIVKGEAKLKSRDELDSYTDLKDAYVFPIDKLISIANKENDQFYTKIYQELSSKKNSILDEIILGDAQEALKMIREFEKYNVGA